MNFLCRAEKRTRFSAEREALNGRERVEVLLDDRLQLFPKGCRPLTFNDDKAIVVIFLRGVGPQKYCI